MKYFEANFSFEAGQKNFNRQTHEFKILNMHYPNMSKVSYVAVLLLIFFTLPTFGQNKPDSNSLINQMEWPNYLIIKINHGSEYYQRSEINVIYPVDNRMKIHSILQSNWERSEQVDTVFTLSGEQLMKIDKFGRDFENNQIKPAGLVIAGTRTYYFVTLNDSTKELDNKSEYSLIMDLLKK